MLHAVAKSAACYFALATCAITAVHITLDDDCHPVKLSLHYITLETIYSGVSKSNFKDHYGDAVIS